MTNNNLGQTAGTVLLSILMIGGITSCQESSQSSQHYSTGSSNQYPNGSTLFARPGTRPEPSPAESNPYETTFPDH